MNFGCLFPRYVHNKYLNKDIPVPCGKCSACTCQKASLWAIRLDLESASMPYTLFVTLSYDDDHLPKLDVRTLDSNSSTWSRSLEESAAFISKHNYMISTFSSKDLSDFFKRLRSRLFRRYEIPEKDRLLRYFVACEYGPTTFRPHYHMLLWFRSPVIAQNIKKCIYESWKCKNAHSSLSSFLRRNKCEFVKNSASSYVAGYLNCSACVPPILLEQPFRAKHYESKCPPLGYFYFFEKQFREFVFGDAVKISYRRRTNHALVNMSLWRSLENRFFPRCFKFSSLSPADRITLYKLSSLPSGFAHYEQFKIWIYRNWDSPAPLHMLVRRLCCDEKDRDVPDEGVEKRLRRLFRDSRIFRSNRLYFGLSVSEYYQRLESYYSRKSYDKLCSQLRFEEEVADSSNIPNLSLQYLPFLIDCGFYENKNSLPTSTYDGYLRQFGLDPLDPKLCRFVNSSYTWYSAKALFDNIRYNNTKNRRKKDYLVHHPEYSLLYSQTYFRSFL